MPLTLPRLSTEPENHASRLPIQTAPRVWRGIKNAWDHRRLMLRMPMLADYESRAAKRRLELTTAYETYVTTTSTRLMGVSMQTATLLRVLCDVLRPRRILDLGSGFSSYVFHSYAATNKDATVMSVDDNSLWLGKTRQFLHRYGLHPMHLVKWTSFVDSKPQPFDLIFHDLGNMDLRSETLPWVLELAARQKKSTVVLDDVHKRCYAPVVKEELTRWDVKYFDLSAYTRDAVGRCAAMVCDVEARGELGLAQSLRRSSVRFATAVAPMPVIGSAVVKTRDWVNRHRPIDLECGVRVIPDRRHRLWRPIAQKCRHERDTDLFLSRYLRRGDAVLDAGANIGLLTAIAAKTVGPAGAVHSFEVEPSNFRELRRTIQRNTLTNVHAHPVALNDEPGQVSFITPSDSWGTFMVNPGGQISRRALDAYFNRTRETRHTYKATTIDKHVRDHGIDRLDVIKIDVDGPELAVLRGGLQTLIRFRPALMVEASMFSLDHGAGFAALFDFLKWQGYWVYASTRGREEVLRVTDPDQAPVDLANEKQAIDLFCRFPGKEDERWSRLWFVDDHQAVKAA